VPRDNKEAGMIVNIKTLSAAIVAVIIILSGIESSAKVTGGYINTYEQEVLVAFDADAGHAVLLGLSMDTRVINDPTDKVRGSLFIVYPNGKGIVSPRAYKDRRGLVVAVPQDKFDKVVFLDNNYMVRGGIGLLNGEIVAVANAYKARDVYKVMNSVGRPADLQNFIDSVNVAGNAADEAYKMPEDERMEVLAATVGINAGAVMRDTVESILIASRESDSLSASSMPFSVGDESAELAFRKVVSGLTFVYDGGDDNGGGGKGLVYDGGDDNGGGGKGLVYDGGDDNGGGGKGSEAAIVQGWTYDIGGFDIPSLKGINAHCAGSFIVID
jgi:hypothetical protein